MIACTIIRGTSNFICYFIHLVSEEDGKHINKALGSIALDRSSIRNCIEVCCDTNIQFNYSIITSNDNYNFSLVNSLGFGKRFLF